MANDPKAHYANGQIDKLHANPSTYVGFGAVALVLALVMLGAAWFRKRLVLGIAMALYGLSIFNLHYWGFGVPFIMVGAWYLVRAYRLSEKLKHAKAETAGGASGYRPPAARPAAVQALHPPGGADPAGAQAQARQGARSRLSSGPGPGARSGRRVSTGAVGLPPRAAGAPRPRRPTRLFASVHTLVTRM